MRRVVMHAGERNLVRSPETFDLLAIHFFRARPTLWRSQDDHWPARASELSGLSRVALNLADLINALFKHLGHSLVHEFRIAAFDEMRRPAISLEQILQLLVRDARQERGVVDLVPIQ